MVSLASACPRFLSRGLFLNLRIATQAGARGKAGWGRAIAMIDRTISTTAALGRGVFGLQLANLAGEFVNALPDRGEGERRCFQPLGRP
jgi:hypothetical protein